MRLILVRHPKPLVAPGVCYGSTDLAVAPEEVARVLAELGQHLSPGLPLFSSPLRRCADLAALLPCASRSVDPRLVEIDFGQWEMRHWDDIPRAEVDAWAADVTAYRPGGGESVLQMAARVAAFHDELLRQPHAGAIVVCHAGTMRLLAARHAGLSLEAMARKAAGAPHQIGYGQCLVLES
jgi:alpha-ribazole phosphatase